MSSLRSRHNLLTFIIFRLFALLQVLDELPLEADTIEKGYSLASDAVGLPMMNGLPSSMYSTRSYSNDSYSASPKTHKSRKSSHSGELQSPFYPNGDLNVDSMAL